MMSQQTQALKHTYDDIMTGALAMEKCNVQMEDVAGLEGQKQELGEAIILPLKFPQLFTGPRIYWRGFLLYGPHGTGKSLLLKAVATEADGVTLISIVGADLAAKGNDGERLLGERSEGYSGSDIYHVVQDALMQPVSKVAAATHFKQVSGPSRSDPAVTLDDLLTPCSPCESGATQMDWTTIPEDNLLVPVVTNGDVDKSLRTFTPACVSHEELERLAEFTNDHASWY